MCIPSPGSSADFLPHIRYLYKVDYPLSIFTRECQADILLFQPEQREIDLFRKYADYYGDVFTLLRESASQTKYFCYSRKTYLNLLPRRC